MEPNLWHWCRSHTQDGILPGAPFQKWLFSSMQPGLSLLNLINFPSHPGRNCVLAADSWNTCLWLLSWHCDTSPLATVPESSSVLATQPGSESQHHRSPVVGPWASYLVSLCFSFLSDLTLWGGDRTYLIVLAEEINELIHVKCLGQCPPSTW